MARGVPRLSVSSAMLSPSWLLGARAGPGLRFAFHCVFATHSAPLPPRPATSQSLTLFRQRRDPHAPGAKSGGLFYSAYFGGWGAAGAARVGTSPRLGTLAVTYSIPAPSRRGGKAGSV